MDTKELIQKLKDIETEIDKLKKDVADIKQPKECICQQSERRFGSD